MDDRETARSSKRLIKWGWAITTAYGVFLAIMGWSAWDELFTQDPNEFGDLLAGVFSPLAFLWLVLGFMQQGEELRQSSQALWLQGRELQHSVEQQKELVAVTREQLEFEREQREKAERAAERAAMPTLVVTFIRVYAEPRNIFDCRFRIVNAGTPCHNVRILHFTRVLDSFSVLASQGQEEFAFRFEGKPRNDVPLAVRFNDALGRLAVQQFILRPFGEQDAPLFEVVPREPEIETLPASEIIETPIGESDPS